MSKAVVHDFSSPRFKIFNLFDDRINDLKQQRPDYSFCSYMNLNVYVGGDLKLYRCCTTAYNDRGEYASIEAKRFKDVWASAEKEADFKAFDARGCDRCMFNAKNRFINYVISPDAAHVNYI